MHLQKVALADTHSFSSFFLDYISQKDSLKQFYGLYPDIENFPKQIDVKKSFPNENRKILSSALIRQYEGVKISSVAQSNLNSMNDSNSFTVTTGHQLNIFTGPLYFIYKIITVINACKKLKEDYPAYNFIPVYWMASEDHDYDEIKSFRLYEKKYTWETDQTGAVGKFDPKSIASLINELPGDVSIFKNAYSKNKTLAHATRQYVNELFGTEGLLVVDGDDHELKSLFLNVIREDLFNHTPKKLVEDKNKQLETAGYHPQIFARDINFFYHDRNVRQRIESEGDMFKVVETNLKFTKVEIENLIETSPEKFSPNVILRPLYQEIILPNIAYIGGPAEVIYWLQLKGVFDHFKIPFPIIMPRNFAVVVSEAIARQIEKTKLSVKDFFHEKNYLFNHWISLNSKHNLSLTKEIREIKSIFENAKQTATGVDGTLQKHVDAQSVRAIKSLETIERKMLRAEKRKQNEKLNQISKVKDYLFPDGNPQERIDNFLNFYQQDPQFIAKLLQLFDPFDFKFNVVEL